MSLCTHLWTESLLQRNPDFAYTYSVHISLYSVVCDVCALCSNCTTDFDVIQQVRLWNPVINYVRWGPSLYSEEMEISKVEPPVKTYHCKL